MVYNPHALKCPSVRKHRAQGLGIVDSLYGQFLLQGWWGRKRKKSLFLCSGTRRSGFVSGVTFLETEVPDDDLDSYPVFVAGLR